MIKDIFYDIVVLSFYIAATAAFIVALTRFEIIESGVFFIVGQLWIIIATLKEKNKLNKIGE